MARASAAGMTDYSHQAFDDMVGDLKDWIINLQQTCKTIETSMKRLSASKKMVTGKK